MGDVCSRREKPVGGAPVPADTTGLLTLQKNWDGQEDELVRKFKAITDSDTLWQIRRTMDSDLTFTTFGTNHVDLRSMLCAVDEGKRNEVFEHFQQIALTAPRQNLSEGLFQVLSDIDDTLTPGHDGLHIAGCDCSIPGGKMYPGVADFHKQLRGADAEAYSVCLTARPPILVHSIPEKFKTICGAKGQMSILPGGTDLIDNTLHILQGNRQVIDTSNDIPDEKELRDRLEYFRAIGEQKVERFKEYWRIFPELAGRYCFIGDDGQADLLAMEEMLEMKNERGQPLLAFCAIHAVKATADTFLVTSAVRKSITEKICGTNPPHTANKTRFFYFVDYKDLTEQLMAAGWIDDAKAETIIDAYKREMAQTATSE